MRETEAQDLVAARAAARERVLREFEQAQTGLTSKAAVGKQLAATASKSGEDGAESRGVKRKFDLDKEEIEKLMKEGEDEALARMTLEMNEAKRAKLPNFWLVSGNCWLCWEPAELTWPSLLCATALSHPECRSRGDLRSQATSFVHSREALSPSLVRPNLPPDLI